jgi:hypothetical protein
VRDTTTEIGCKSLIIHAKNDEHRFPQVIDAAIGQWLGKSLFTKKPPVF